MDQVISSFPHHIELSTILKRPVGAGPRLSLRVLERHRDEILRKAAGLEEQGGGLLLITHTEGQEPSVLLLLTLFIGRLKRQGKPVRLYRSRLEPELPATLPDRGYLLVHQFPQCPGLLELLETDLTPGRVVIATGLREEWESLQLHLPHLFYRLPEGAEEGEQALNAVVQIELDGYRQMGPDAKAYFLVALFDAWGIPLPFSLLARALNRDEDEVGVLVEKAHTQHLLSWIELEKPPALLVSTKSPLVARMMVGTIRSEGKTEAEVLNEYATVIRAVDPEDKGERYTVLKLFQALLRGSHQWETVRNTWGIQESRRRWLLELIHRTDEAINQIWQRGDATEHLLWGKLLEELRLFEESDRVFRDGLHHAPDNPFLLHAQAKMLGEWARFESLRYPAADQAFREAARRMPENPYVWQAWGVMEKERGNARQASGHFEQALQAAHATRRSSDTIYTLVAWADLEIERGNYAKAEALLNQAGELSPSSLYVPHLRGKMAFYQGNYPGAEEHLNGVLAIDPVNVPALNTLGDMALKRGHWKRAEQLLHQALRINPENIPTLHALGELWVERGDLAASVGEDSEALTCYGKAEERLLQILELELKNRHALVALGRLYTKWARLEPERARKAEARLDEALRLHPTNKFALHVLGELKREQGAMEEAEQHFMRVLQQDRENLPALLSLADLYLTQGRRDEAQELLNRVGRDTGAIERGEFPLPTHELIRAYNMWAWVELKAEKREQALTHVEQAIEHDRENAYTHRTYAQILEAMGRDEDARMHREKARTLGMVLDEAEKAQG